MRIKEYIFKHIYNPRLWVLAALLSITHGFIQGQNIEITYDNPITREGLTSTGTNVPDSYNFNALIPASATSVTGKAYGGGGGGGYRNISLAHGAGGGGGGYIEKNFGATSGFATGQVGAGGKRGENGNDTDATDGAYSSIVLNGITIIAYGGGYGSSTGNAGAGGGTSISEGAADIFRTGSSGGNAGSGAGGAGGNSGGYPDYGGGAGAGYFTNGTGASQGYNGYNPGGGGGGARANLANANPGGHGGGGRVVLSYNIKALTITASANQCQGSTITLTASYGPGTNVTFQWYKDNSPISGATGKTYTITNAQTSNNGSYTVKATYNITYSNATTVTGSSLPTGLSLSGNSLTGTVTSSSVSITVNPKPAISGKTTTICSEETFTVTPSNTSPDVVPTGTTYSWSIPTLPAGVTGATAGTDEVNISGTLTNVTVIAQTVTYTVTPKAGNGCDGTPFNVVVTVNPKPIIAAKTATICSGETFTITPSNMLPDVVPAGTTYSWSVPILPTGVTATGENTGTNESNISGTLTNATATPLNVTYVVTPKAGSCSGTSFNVVVTVNPKPVISNKTITVCSGEVFAVTPSNTSPDVVPAGTTYSWSVPTLPAGVTGATVGTNETNISGTLVNTSSTAQNVTYQVTPSMGSCIGASFDVVVTIKPKPVISGKTATICSGEIFTVAPSNTSSDVVPTGTTYSWSIPSLPTGVTGATAGTNAANISGTLVNTTATDKTVTYVVTPKIANGCDGASFNVVVTINPKPIIAAKTATICSGETFTVIPTNVSADVVPSGTTYSWVTPTLPEGVTGATAGSNAANISGTLTNTTATAQTVTYVVTPSVGSCDGASFDVVVTVNPKPIISGKTATICSGETFTVTPASPDVMPAGTTYSWSAPSPPPGVTGATAGANEANISGTLTNTTETVQTVTYVVTPKAGNGCYGTSFNVVVTVNPKPIISDETATICSGETFTVTPTSPNVVPTGTTYSWSAPTLPAGVTATGATTGTNESNISGTLTNATAAPLNVTYVVTPSAGNCNGTPFNVVVTVNPKPIISNKTVTACNEVAFSVTPTSPDIVPAGTTYDWAIQLPLPTGVTADALTGTNVPNISGTLTNITSAAQEVTYVVSPKAGNGCVGNSFNVLVTVNPQLILSVTDLIGYVQPAGTPSLDLSDYLGVDSQYLEWYNSQPDANGGMNEIGEPTSLDLTQTTTATYWLVKTDEYGCRSLPVQFNIELFSMPEITIDADKDLVCPGTQVAVAVNISGGTAPYFFKVKNMNSGIVDDQTVNNPGNLPYSFNVNPLSSVAYRITYFSDKNTSRVTYPNPLPYGLEVPATGYFDEALLSVIVTEIIDITPNSGPTSGGIYTVDARNPINPDGTVTINGSGFAPFGTSTVSSVTFGGVAAINITVIDDNTLTCTPPAHAPGLVTVAITTGCTTATLTNGYDYESINITETEPAYAPVTGGTVILIQGSGLAIPGNENSVTVTLAGVPAQIVSVTSTEIKCIANQSNFSLLGSIIINNGSETREFPKSFTYYPVNFIENGKWSEPHRWETQTADHILPYPGAVIQINANCVQDTIVNMDSITVHASKAYTLEDGIVLKANVFTLKENASFIDKNANNANMQAVQQNVEHVLTKGRNWYISNPLSDPAGLTANNDRIEWYNETTKAWESTTNLNIGQGYTIYSADTDIGVKFSGKYNDGNQTSPILTQTEGLKQGFNLVGNPFPSYWHWTSEAAQEANLYSTIWYRTNVGGVYEFWSYNASGDVAVAPGWKDATPTGSYSLGYIPPMQAFWVRVLDGQTPGTLTFADNRRSHADHGSNILKSAGANNEETRPMLRIEADNGLSVDETVVYADSKAKEGFDTYDSEKWFVNQGIEIFTLSSSSSRGLVINGLPEIADDMEIPLGFQVNEGGNFSFRAKEILNLDDLDVFLSDKRRNIEFNLRDGDYNFASGTASDTGRFSIVFRKAAGNGLHDTGSESGNLRVYTNEDGQLIVTLHHQNREGTHATVSVFDIAGRKLTTESIIVGEPTTLKYVFSEGVYIVRAEKYMTKVMVKK